MKRTVLIKARESKGLSQAEVAARAKISRCFYTQIENGTRTPALSVALRISEALGVPVNDIFVPSDVSLRNTGTNGG